MSTLALVVLGEVALVFCAGVGVGMLLGARLEVGLVLGVAVLLDWWRKRRDGR